MGGAYSGDVFPNALFKNPGVEGNHWVTLRFEGTVANCMAIGGRVRLQVEDAKSQAREIHRVIGTGGSFGSSSLQLEVGLGTATRIVSLDVVWPGSGGLSHFEEVPMDSVLEVREGESFLQRLEVSRFPMAKGSEQHFGH